ncbi:hypothetical protein ACFV1L_10255 [Kitasatospora sp. NPDC059646]|uniref:hypothetical protein n=1 Tax=Kitasatospora sp. NPDC059646 TaxID=3346893 RepID=UPI00368ECAD9
MMSTYRAHFMGTRKLLLHPGMAVAVVAAATTMQPIAESLSPVGDAEADPHPGLYRGSWRVATGTKSVRYRGRPTKRVYGRLENTARYARDVEYGSRRVRRYAVARRTVDAAVSRNG